MQYEWEKYIGDVVSEKSLDNWVCKFGPRVISRNNTKAEKVEFSLLIDNPDSEVFLVGDFNDWGKDNIEEYKLIHDKDSLFATVLTDKIKHKDRYKFLYNGKLMQDPAGHYFDDLGNTIFWDFKDPSCYRQKYNFINTTERSTKIIQTDLPGLIVHWANDEGICARDIEKKGYYNFIAESGILKYLRELGFNTIQFLPFAQSIDGDNWKFRYLVPYQYAIQKNWGSPDDFSKMIDECHKQGIAVIGDFVLGHLPFKDYNVFGMDGKDNGLQVWKNRHGYELYMKEETSWGTMRLDFDNKFVRKFFISSCVHYMQKYRIDGFRIDNVDGIIRYGSSGEGDERPNGRTFLRELTKTIYTYNKKSLIHFESHYFNEDNAKMLVVPYEEDDRALGATAYNSSRLTYYFHKEFMQRKFLHGNLEI